MAALGTSFVDNRRVTADATDTFFLEGNWVLLEEQGIMVSISRVNIQIAGNFQWAEDNL